MALGQHLDKGALGVFMLRIAVRIRAEEARSGMRATLDP